MAFGIGKILETAKRLFEISGPSLISQPFFVDGNGLVKDWEGQIVYRKTLALIFEVQRYVGLKEDGPNKGQMIERFQRAVDGVAQGEPYCLAGLFFSIDNVDEFFDWVFQKPLSIRSRLFRTEHVLTLWNKTPREQRVLIIAPGVIFVLAQFKNGTMTGSGHVELVIAIIDNVECWCVGFNTSGPNAREGDGIYLKKRNYVDGFGDLRPLGFLKPW